MLRYYRNDERIFNYITKKIDIVNNLLREDFSLWELNDLFAQQFGKECPIHEIKTKSKTEIPVDLLFYSAN